VPPEKLDPGDDDRSAPDHCVERLQGLLLAEPRDLFDQELKIGLDRTEIDVLGIPSWHRGMVIVWHGIDHARSWLTVGYDEKRWNKLWRATGNNLVWEYQRACHDNLDRNSYYVLRFR